VRQLLTESALLACFGGLLGVLLAAASMGFLRRLIPEDLSYATSLTWNLPVFGFAILVSLASTFLFGLAPARQLAKGALNDDLWRGGRGSIGARHALGGALVSGTIALSLMLLVTAGLLLKSLNRLQLPRAKARLFR
jgi:putative ABC transport system permease protein